MRRAQCESCRSEVRFDAMRCPTCGTPHGYLPTQQRLRTLTANDDGVSFRVVGDVAPRWRCLNAAWGCNWLLPAGSGDSWCLSCALTRGRPDVGRADAIEAWSAAEAAKRRLVDQLMRLGLPVHQRSPRRPDGLTFDLVDIPGERGLTGHLDGVVTIDLAEADDQRRDELRRALGEPYRTLLGNLRHEVGHHYWGRLVGQGSLTTARRLFGDERTDYGAALQRHYAAPPSQWDATRFVSRYATAHPAEDWAETFAHYLHLADALETASAYGLACSTDDRPIDLDAPMGDLVDSWLRLAVAVDAIAEAVGVPVLFPFRPTGAVVDKLEFVHAMIRGQRPPSAFDDAERRGGER